MIPPIDVSSIAESLHTCLCFVFYLLSTYVTKTYEPRPKQASKHEVTALYYWCAGSESLCFTYDLSLHDLTVWPACSGQVIPVRWLSLDRVKQIMYAYHGWHAEFDRCTASITCLCFSDFGPLVAKSHYARLSTYAPWLQTHRQIHVHVVMTCLSQVSCHGIDPGPGIWLYENNTAICLFIREF